MPLAGKKLLPREIAQLGRSHWKDWELVKMVATAMGESAGYVGAWHDNEYSTGILSRDCGLMQINIRAEKIATPAEEMLRTESLDHVAYWSTAQANVAAAYHLYEQPWPYHDIRRWQPWVAYTTGWATFPSFWVWHQENGKPIGPWLPTGRYLHQAIAGVANFHVMIRKDMTLEAALAYAVKAAAHFGVDADLHARRGYVAFQVPRKPDAPPQDGVGPRPVPNDGV